MNILLTGGAGYIGSHTALSLIEEGHSVTVIDNLITGSKKLIPSQVKYYECDIADKEAVEKILKQNKFDIVMHFAGLTRVDESVKDPKKYEIHNFEKSKAFFKNCFENNIKRNKINIRGYINKYLFIINVTSKITSQRILF